MDKEEGNEAPLQFTGSYTVSVDRRARIRLPNTLYGIIATRTRNLPYAVKEAIPEVYFYFGGEEKLLFDRRTLYGLSGNWGISLAEGREIDFGDITCSSTDKQQRVQLPKGYKSLVGKIIQIRASKRGEFLHIERVNQKQQR